MKLFTFFLKTNPFLVTKAERVNMYQPQPINGLNKHKLKKELFFIII